MKITIIGAGNMGGAIARGLAKGSKLVTASDITCTDAFHKNLDLLKAEFPLINVSDNNAAAVKNADLILLAVKPWVLPEVIREIKRSLDYERQLIVSIAGGVKFNDLNDFFQKDNDFDAYGVSTLFRVIPNTAIDVLSSMTFISSVNASKEQDDLIMELFSDLGHVLLIPESQMTAATALASCGIAFALRYIRAATEGGVELGIPAYQAKEIVAQTVKGAAELLLVNHTHPEVEIDRVTTAGGITIKGLNEMEQYGFTNSVIKGLKASK